MIGQQYAPGTGSDALAIDTTHERRAPWRRMPGGRSARRILDGLGGSALVQLMLAMTLVALVAMIYLAQASQASVAEVNIRALVNDRARLQMQSANLQGTATQLTSLTRIEGIASGRLQMHRADLSMAVWIRPEVPRLLPIHSESADTRAASERSQPMAWIARFVQAVKSSL